MKTLSILVIDLECCCWDGKPAGEIIQIGGCKLNPVTLEITDTLSLYVRPEKDEISEFCTQLTGITKELIKEKGMPLAEANNMLIGWYNSAEMPMASWGAFDKRKMIDECFNKKLPYPFGKEHINIKNLFSVLRGEKDYMGMDKALKLMDLPLVGRHHDGLDDALNIAKIFKRLMSDCR